MLNPIFWKKVQWRKHPGRWGIVEHQMPSFKVLFKTNTKSHKYPGIRPLSSESKTLLVYRRQQKVAFNPGTAHAPEIQSHRMWCGAASPTLNDTPVVCIYTYYNRNYKVNIYIHILTKRFRSGTKIIRRKDIIQPTGFGACSSICRQWDADDVPAPWERSKSHPPVWVQKSCVNQFL